MVQTHRQLLPSAEIGTAQQDDLMGIRKSIASGLMATANALAQDQTKERTQKLINRARHKLADAIKPKTIRDTKWVDDMFNV